MTRPSPFTLCVAAVLLGMFPDFAFSQAAPQPGAASGTPAQTAGPEVGQRGERKSIRQIKYGDWRKLCFKTPGAKMTCRTTISGTWETGQNAVRVDLIEREGDSARLQLFLPVGLYLQAGVKLTIDQGATYSIPYTWCLTNTCIAAEPAEPKAVQDMESGTTLTIEVVDSNVLAVSTSLPLGQFAAVHRGPPAEIYAQEINE